MGEFKQYRHFGAFRLLLAALVVCQHFFANVAPGPFAAAMLPYAMGNVAVLVFFALSGFVIFEAAVSVYPGKPAAFLANRFLRIAPQFLAAAIISITAYAAFDGLGALRVARDGAWPVEAAFSPWNILLNLVSFLPFSDRFISYNFLPIAWALRVEMSFYAFVALAIFLLAAGKRLFRVSFGLPAVGAVVAALTAPMFVLATLGKGPALFQFTPYFTFGCALFVATRRPGAVCSGAIGLSAAGMLWQFYCQHAREIAAGQTLTAGLLFVLLAGLLCAMTALSFARIRAFKRADRAVGDLTYPLYLSHSYVSVVFQSMTPCDTFAVLFAAFAESLLIAWASRGIIDPAVNRLRDMVRGHGLRDEKTTGEGMTARWVSA